MALMPERYGIRFYCVTDRKGNPIILRDKKSKSIELINRDYLN